MNKTNVFAAIGILVTAATAQGEVPVDSERAMVLLKRQWTDFRSGFGLRYELARRNLHEDKATRWESDSCVRWWLGGSMEHLDARCETLDADGRIVSVTIWSGEEVYEVAPNGGEWRATISKGGVRGQGLDDNCPVQRSLFATGGVLFHELTRLGLQQARLRGEDCMLGFLPTRKDMPEVARRLGAVTGMLGWHLEFARSGDLWNLSAVWEVFSQGYANTIPGSLAYLPMGLPSVVHKRTVFTDYVPVGGVELPTKMSAHDPNGFLEGEIRGAIQIVAAPDMKKVLEFRPPPEFGPKGVVDDRVRVDVVYVGYEHGSKDRALSELIASGAEHPLIVKNAQGMGRVWWAVGAIILVGLSLGWRRARGGGVVA